MSLKEHEKFVASTMEEVRRLRGEQDKLYKELEDSLLIKRLCPTVFDHGPAKTRIEGGRMFTRYVIIRGDGEEFVFFVKDVPTRLWFRRLMEMHKTTSMGNWPRALKDEYMKRRAKAQKKDDDE